MKPVETPDCNFTYHLASGSPENDLHCHLDEETLTVTSFWEAEPDEDFTDVMWLSIVVYGYPDTKAEFAWADTLEAASFLPLPLESDDDNDGLGWIELDEHTMRRLQARSAFILRVHSVPTPPVSVALATPEHVIVA